MLRLLGDVQALFTSGVFVGASTLNNNLQFDTVSPCYKIYKVLVAIYMRSLSATLTN